MANGRPNIIKRFFKWLLRMLTFQAFWKKPGPNESMKFFSTSPTKSMTVIHNYESAPPDPVKTATTYTSYMNRDVNVCENFYDFVCGKFPGANPIPPWFNAVAATDFRVHEINKKILVYLETEQLKGPPVFQKIQTFYKGCMNEASIHQMGMQTIIGELSLVDLPPDPLFAFSISWTYKYMDRLAKIHRLTPLVDFLFDISVQVDPKSSQINKIFFGNTPATTHASANAETEGFYSFAKFSNVFNAKTEAEPDGQRYQAVRIALSTYIRKVVDFMDRETEVGSKRKYISRQFVPDAVQKVTNFLLELEKTRQMGKYNRVENIIRTTLFDIQTKVNFMDKSGCVEITWTKYFETLFAGLSGPRGSTGYFTKNNQEILYIRYLVEHLYEGKTKVIARVECPPVLAMWFVVVHSVAPLGPKSIQDYRNEYLRTVFGVEQVPRQLTCLNLVRTHFGYFVGHILAQDARSKQEQLKVIDMVSNIKFSLLDAIQQATWMDPATKAGAKTKLNSVSPFISVWETLQDPNKLEQFYGNSFELGPSFQFTYTTLLRKKRADMLQSLFFNNDFERKVYPNPASIYSRYYPSFVHLTVPIGALDYPFYDLGTEAFNYGALGVLITREVWRAVDATGRYYDQHGDGYPWWMPPTVQEYGKREAALVNFYSAIQLPVLRINVDGIHTAIENVADLVGFEVGLKAYHRHLKLKGVEKETDEFNGFTYEKWFTIAFANMHCIHASLEYTYGQVTEDENPPQSIRVNAVTMNSNEFARIWGCPPRPVISF